MGTKQNFRWKFETWKWFFVIRPFNFFGSISSLSDPSNTIDVRIGWIKVFTITKFDLFPPRVI